MLIVEPDSELAESLAQTLCRHRGHASRGGSSMAQPSGRCCCQIVSSLRQLHDCELEHVELVLCAVTLPDGTALDATAYLQGMRRELPVIIVSAACDNVLAAELIRAGALDFVVTGREQHGSLTLAVEKCRAHQRIKQENQRLHHELSRFVGELADKNLQLQMMVNQLETMARTDELTGLSNRRWLNEMLERAWAEAVRHDRPLAFLMMDLDDFKLLNDEGGHQRGDAILRLTGRVLMANCRQVDVAARYGGDEFCILMPQTEAHEAVQVAQRISREFDTAIESVLAGGLKTGISIGVSHVDLSRPLCADQLIAHADEAMYAAKTSAEHRIMLRSPVGPRPDRDPTRLHDAAAFTGIRV